MKPYFKHLASPFRRQLDAAVFTGSRRICEYMRIGYSTFRLWHDKYGFPASRTPDCRWIVSAALVDEWLRERLQQQRREAEVDQ
jgi:hypothetical protein